MDYTEAHISTNWKFNVSIINEDVCRIKQFQVTTDNMIEAVLTIKSIWNKNTAYELFYFPYRQYQIR